MLLFAHHQVVDVSCGIAEVYVSYTNPNPNPALYAEKYTATDGHPAYLMSESRHNGQPVYITVIGSRLPPTAEGLETCPGFNYTVTPVINRKLLSQLQSQRVSCYHSFSHNA